MILQVENVTKKFGGLVALNEVNVDIEEGEIVGIIGPNGAGKSTLLNVIAGVHQPNSGFVRFGGQKINDWPPERICRMGIARTFQIPHPFPKMTPLENVLVAATFGQHEGVKDPYQYAKDVMEFVDYPVDEQNLAANLTTSQLRRLELARALASKPRLLLLDETAAGLTPLELVDIQNLILKIRDQGVTVLIVEHLMRLIMQLCDRVVVLHYGVKIADGTPADIAENENVTNAYLGEKYLLA